MRLIPNISQSGRTEWILHDEPDDDGDAALVIEFHLGTHLRQREAMQFLANLLEKAEFNWISVAESELVFDFDSGWANLSDLSMLSWLKGKASFKPFIDQDQDGDLRTETVVSVKITEEALASKQENRIFLSHKGSDKPLVRDFAETLRVIGFNPWLDEDDLAAGDKQERALLRGMEESCAAVFFITDAFRDEGYLEAEADYAIQQERLKPGRFRIITLVLSERGGLESAVPGILKRFVYKSPTSDLEALREIIKALPRHLRL